MKAAAAVERLSLNMENKMEKKKVGRPKEWTNDRLLTLGARLIEWLNMSDDNLFFEDFLVQNDLYGDLLNRHLDESTEFRELIQKAKIIQEIKLNRLAIRSKIQPVYTMFFMKNHHGYTDRQETIIRGDFPQINFGLLQPIINQSPDQPLQIRDQPLKRLIEPTEPGESE